MEFMIVQHYEWNVAYGTKLCILKWLILCPVNFNSIFKNEDAINKCVEMAGINLNAKILRQRSIIKKSDNIICFQKWGRCNYKKRMLLIITLEHQL